MRIASVSMISDMAAKLGIDVGGQPELLATRLAAYDAELQFAYKKVLEDEETPERFKTFDVANFAMFIKEKFDEAIAQLEEEQREKRREYDERQKVFMASLEAAQSKVKEVDSLMRDCFDKAIQAGKMFEGTEHAWERFKASLGA